MDSTNCCDFSGHYERSSLAAMKALELDVLGCDYGGTSWTTSRQAKHIMSSLALDSQSHLLEIGCGSGWPGLYLSTTSGCSITLLDMPLIALRQAADRAATDSIRERVNLVNGSGTALPFADASFDRLSHSDVLCCLPEKLEMLDECRRVATDGALMHFAVIMPAAGLAPADHERVIETGPPFIGTPDSYDSLLGISGWRITDRIDVTSDYADSVEQLATGLKKNTPELQEAFGVEELRAAWHHREDQVSITRAGLMQRIVYVASTV